MTREQWMRDLREALEAEMPQNDIDSNISYYRDYIDSQSAAKTEQAVLEELGDARLIAHTIIDSYKMQRGTGAYENSWAGSSYDDTSDTYQKYRSAQDDSYENQNSQYGQGGPKIIQIRWYHKLLLIAILIALLVVLGFLGKLAFIIFLRIGIPVILVYLIYSMFRRR